MRFGEFMNQSNFDFKSPMDYYKSAINEPNRIYFCKILGTLPFALLSYLGKIFNFLMQLLAYRKDVINENLKSFPNKTLKEIEIIHNQFYKYLSQVIIEVLKMFHITESEII